MDTPFGFHESQWTGVIRDDLAVVTAHEHRWAVAVQDLVHYVSLATVQRDEWAKIRKAAETSQVIFRTRLAEVFLLLSAELGSDKNMLEAPQQLQSVADWANKATEAGCKAAKEA